MIKLAVPILSVLGLTALMADKPASPAVADFFCTVSGGKALTPAMSKKDVCANITAVLKTNLGAPVQTVSRASQLGRNGVDWVRADVSFSPRGVAIARVSQSRKGKTHNFPQISVSVMDKPMDAETVDLLAREIARNVAAL